MVEEFEWVEKGSGKEKESDNTLPVAVKKKDSPSTFQKAGVILWKAVVILGTLILSLFAKILLLLARIKIPAVSIPAPVKAFGRGTYARIRSIRFRKPSWVRIPSFITQIRIPRDILNALLSGLCFVFALAGAGAFFAILTSGGSWMNYILLIVGIASFVWLTWSRSAANALATWILRILRERKSRK